MKAGADVTIIDKHHTGQATDAAAGIICPWLSQRRNKAWYQLAKGGARMYPSLIDELAADGETDTGYAQTGAISIHTNQEKLAAMKERALNAVMMRRKLAMSPFSTQMKPKQYSRISMIAMERYMSAEAPGSMGEPYEMLLYAVHKTWGENGKWKCAFIAKRIYSNRGHR